MRTFELNMLIGATFTYARRHWRDLLLITLSALWAIFALALFSAWALTRTNRIIAVSLATWSESGDVGVGRRWLFYVGPPWADMTYLHYVDLSRNSQPGYFDPFLQPISTITDGRLTFGPHQHFWIEYLHYTPSYGGGFGFRHPIVQLDDPNEGNFERNLASLVFPPWILPSVALAVMVIPAGIASSMSRRWRRARADRFCLCRACNYDLRASHDRCPECGMAIHSKTPADAGDSSSFTANHP